jgi:thiamine pyrophosphate-dependent acetolactate synthase large subunit-like protein
MRRVDACATLGPLVKPEDLVVVSIGMLKDDWWNHRSADNAFYSSVLGTCSTMGLGLASALPHRRVIALDSDGGILLNLGVLTTLGAVRPANLTVVVMDNGRYDSTGGHSTHTARNTNLARMAEGAGCQDCITATDTAMLGREFQRMLTDDRLGFLVAKLDAGRHPWTPEQQKPTDGIEDKYQFLRYVERLEGKVIHSGIARH